MAMGHITIDDLPYLNSTELYLLQSRPIVIASTSPPGDVSGSSSGQESLATNEEQAENQQNQTPSTLPISNANVNTNENKSTFSWKKIDWFWVVIGFSVAGLLVTLGMRKKEKNDGNVDRERP